jgi:hypothetical protein
VQTRRSVYSARKPSVDKMVPAAVRLQSSAYAQGMVKKKG